MKWNYENWQKCPSSGQDNLIVRKCLTNFRTHKITTEISTNALVHGDVSQYLQNCDVVLAATTAFYDALLYNVGHSKNRRMMLSTLVCSCWRSIVDNWYNNYKGQFDCS